MLKKEKVEETNERAIVLFIFWMKQFSSLAVVTLEKILCVIHPVYGFTNWALDLKYGSLIHPYLDKNRSKEVKKKKMKTNGKGADKKSGKKL